MTKPLLRAGDIVAIPILDERVILGRVLYVSSVFKDLILLGVYALVFDVPTMPDALPRSFAFEPIYTSSIGVRKSGWEVVGHQDISDGERGASLRITGGEVWVEDRRLRAATGDDYKDLRQMVVFGYPYLRKKIGEVLEKSQSASVPRITITPS